MSLDEENSISWSCRVVSMTEDAMIGCLEGLTHCHTLSNH